MKNKLFKTLIVLFLMLNLSKNFTYANDIYIPFAKNSQDNTETINFRDLNLKQSLIEYYKFNIDKNFNGKEITKKMMEEFTSLTLSWANIFSLEGLEYAKNVKYLDLSNNFIEDITVLSNLKNLKELNLSNNKIKDANSLKDLKELTKLSIKKNLLSDIKFINDLYLEELDLSKNDILKNKIKNLEKIDTLRILKLNSIGLENIEFIGNYKNLEELYVSENRLKDLKGLENLTNLRILHIDKNNIADISSLKNLINLSELVASKNNIVEVEHLNNKKNLHRIMLDDNFNLNNIEIFKNIDNLASLSLDNTQVSTLKPLYNLKYLFYVSLVGVNIDENEISLLKENNEKYKKNSNLDKKIEIITHNSNKYFSFKNYIFMAIIIFLLISGIVSYWKKNN